MKCLHPDRPCSFRDNRGFCHFSLAVEAGWKCPSDCPWLMKTMIGGDEVMADCLVECVYELPEECRRRKELVEKARGDGYDG